MFNDNKFNKMLLDAISHQVGARNYPNPLASSLQAGLEWGPGKPLTVGNIIALYTLRHCKKYIEQNPGHAPSSEKYFYDVCIVLSTAADVQVEYYNKHEPDRWFPAAMDSDSFKAVLEGASGHPVVINPENYWKESAMDF